MYHKTFSPLLYFSKTVYSFRVNFILFSACRKYMSLNEICITKRCNHDTTKYIFSSVALCLQQLAEDYGRQNDIDRPQSVTQSTSAYVAWPRTDDNATVRALIAPRPPNIDTNESSGERPSIITRAALNFQRTLFQVPLRDD